MAHPVHAVQGYWVVVPRKDAVGTILSAWRDPNPQVVLLSELKRLEAGLCVLVATDIVDAILGV
jgi:hypothetical protein